MPNLDRFMLLDRFDTKFELTPFPRPSPGASAALNPARTIGVTTPAIALGFAYLGLAS